MKIFYNENNDKTIQCCGYVPIIVTDQVMKAWGVKEGKKRHYCHSGKASGDNNSVVGYGSVVYY